MRATTEATAADQIKATDEKIRSVLMALSFFVAGMVTVVYATRAGAHPAKPLTWDGHARNVSTVFMVMFGGSVFFAVMWALTALDPETYRPMFVIGEGRSAQWSVVEEARFKASRFAESQAFVTVIVATSVLLGITQLPTTSSGTRSGLVCVALVTFAVAPSLSSAGLWWFRGSWGWTPSWRRRVILFYLVVPALAIVLTLLAFVHGSQMKWVATIYTLFWLLISRLVQHRATVWSTRRAPRVVPADCAAVVWFVAGLLMLILAASNVWPGVLSLHTALP